MKVTLCFLILLATSTFSLPVNPKMDTIDFYSELQQEVGRSILLIILSRPIEAMEIPEDDQEKTNVFRLYY